MKSQDRNGPVPMPKGLSIPSKGGGSVPPKPGKSGKMPLPNKGPARDRGKVVTAQNPGDTSGPTP